MKYTLSIHAAAALALAAGCAHGSRGTAANARSQLTESAPTPVASPPAALPELWASELLEPGAVLRPSAKALALAGQRMRLVGFVAELEEALEGALYLTAVPVQCDEAGGGTADLPPEAVLVFGAALAGKRFGHVAGPVEGIGRFRVENRADAAGRVSNFQLELDEPDQGVDLRRAEHARRD